MSEDAAHVAEMSKTHRINFDSIDTRINTLQTMSAECGALLTKVAITNNCLPDNAQASLASGRRYGRKLLSI